MIISNTRVLFKYLIDLGKVKHLKMFGSRFAIEKVTPQPEANQSFIKPYKVRSELH